MKYILLLVLLLHQKNNFAQSINLQWGISNVGVVLYPCVSSFSATANYVDLPAGSVIDFIVPEGFIVSGNTNVSGTGSETFTFIYSGPGNSGALTFDCFVTLPNSTIIQADFTGPSDLTIIPSSNTTTVFQGGVNPIEFFGFNNIQVNSVTPISFPRGLSVRIKTSEIQSINVSYSDELDVTETTSSNSPTGDISVQSLQLSGTDRIYTFSQNVSMTNCPEQANAGVLTVAIACADGTTQTYTQSLNANFIINPPSFNTSNFQFTPPEGLSYGCGGNYVLSFNINKQNSTIINLQDLDFTYNSGLYNLESTKIDGIDLSSIQTNGYLFTGNSISVVCTLSLNCGHFQTCEIGQDFLMNLSTNGMTIRYKSTCAPFTEYSMTAGTIDIGSEQTVVLVGGPTENSFTDTNDPIDLNYQLYVGLRN